jgi:uncharacterized LabA/DUF88 family protein
MTCVAVFVDAGYLFAQGSTALTGSKKSRSELKLNETAVVAELTAVARTKSGNSRLLRVYWYDGSWANRPGLSLEHELLAHTDFIKLRLGQMNNQGQQKGVDSLIVTDLIELARNHAITDAVLLSGDEDVRIGVQIAQSFGVRVHLLGIVPSRGSQSILLLQEADTTTEWDKATVAKFLSHRHAAPASLAIQTVTASQQASQTSLDGIVRALHASLDSDDIAAFETFQKTSRGLPREIDGKLLAQARALIGRNLEPEERRLVRASMVKLLQGKAI